MVYSNLAIYNLLKPIGEDDVLKEDDLSTQAILITAQEELLWHFLLSCDQNCNSSLMPDDKEHIEFSTIEYLKGLAVANIFSEQKGLLGESLNCMFVECKRSPRPKRVA